MNICFRSGPCRSASIRFDKTIVTSNEPTFRGVAWGAFQNQSSLAFQNQSTELSAALRHRAPATGFIG